MIPYYIGAIYASVSKNLQVKLRSNLICLVTGI